jgi:hypothetical protein
LPELQKSEAHPMTDMTLEQVRDWHRKMSLAHGYWSAQRAHEKMADAIDAAIKTRGEPVAWMATCMGPIYAREVFRTRKEAEECGDGWDHCHITPLYTAPPTDDRPTWEEVREMLAISARPCATSTFNEKQIADRIIAEFRKRPA